MHPIRYIMAESVRVRHLEAQEEMDLKVLQFQNKKLAQRLEQRRRIEEDLRNRIEQLEKRQTTDDAVMCIVNRYWNQLDEDMRVVLQRFDWEVADESEDKDESEELTSFLESLSTWDRNELDQKLTQRVQFSERAVGKVMQCFDRQLQRYEKLVKTLRGSSESSPADIKLKEGEPLLSLLLLPGR
ncbi:PREDICTED: E3 ubiquitin-protein ligase Bre1-like [Priapulus caudatus]|uniref:E3 ubiquitin protein ligase n=1 Tax=Priapulus caudatus TaxID=37621 RepID=A0ABM1F1N8_PRICU|nr:PREDICTED: E3 ubiquitin-protein ligase Bre1-like [Priapulus caudatus]